MMSLLRNEPNLKQYERDLAFADFDASMTSLAASPIADALANAVDETSYNQPGEARR